MGNFDDAVSLSPYFLLLVVDHYCSASFRLFFSLQFLIISSFSPWQPHKFDNIFLIETVSFYLFLFRSITKIIFLFIINNLWMSNFFVSKNFLIWLNPSPHAIAKLIRVIFYSFICILWWFFSNSMHVFHWLE